MRFDEVIGQEATINRLKQMVRHDRVPHALLFCGPSGAGKYALALSLGCELLRTSRQEDSLFGNSAISANTEAMLGKLEHPDLHFTFPTIKTPSMGSDHQPVSNDFIREWHELLMQGPYFSIDQWMRAMGAANQQAIITGGESDELSRKLSLKSSQGGYKVSIIWLPERMNLTSANKLLKLLEEPPRQTVFILVSENPEKLLATILSRTQRIDVKGISTDAIEQALISRRGIDADNARRIARVANGNWRRALDALDADNENRQFLDLFINLMRLSYMRNLRELKEWSEEVSGLGREKQRRMLLYFMRQVRENFIYNFHQPELNYFTQEEQNFAHNFSRYINEDNVIEINELFEKAYRDVGQNANPKIVFFDLTLQIIVLLVRKK